MTLWAASAIVARRASRSAERQRDMQEPPRRESAAPPPARGPRWRREARRTLAFLADLSQALAVSLDLRKTLPEAINRVADFMQAEGRVAVPARSASTCSSAAICVGPVDMTGVRLAIGQGVVGRCGRPRTRLRSSRTRAPIRACGAPADDGSGFVTRSLLCAPL